MDYPEIIVLSLNLLFCVPSAASLTKFDYWWVRGFDFPRVQISVLICANIVLAIWFYPFDAFWNYLVVGILFLSLVYQLIMIFPYTKLASKEVIRYGGSENDDNISILISNVLMTNREYSKLIDLVLARNPDVLLTLETDKAGKRHSSPSRPDTLIA